MDDKYITDKSSVSYICYHIVFCPRYRRKIFDIPKVAERFTELAREVCSQNNISVLKIECIEDYVYMWLKTNPKQSPHDVSKVIKFYTAPILIKEFKELSKMRSLWTTNYFASTEDTLDQNTIASYVQTQKKRSG